jgi:hypothetical protein
LDALFCCISHAWCFVADDKATPPPQPGSVAAAEAALDRLAARLRPPSIGAQIRRLLPKIEATIASGASHEQIVETLRESGTELSLKTFRSALYRARKRAQRGGRKEGAAGDAPAAPAKPRAFAWDPAARPVITFIDKDDEPES